MAPQSRAAAMVSTLKVEPGSYPSEITRLRHCFSLAAESSCR